MSRLLGALVVAAVAVGARAAPAAPTPDLISARAVSDGFALEFTLPRSTWRVHDVIEGEAVLSLLEGDTATISGSGMDDPIAFMFATDGARIDPVRPANCARFSLARDAPIRSPITKSGAFDPDDPNEAWLAPWFRDPALHLPPGEWQITALAQFYEGTECEGGRKSFRAPLTIQVTE